MTFESKNDRSFSDQLIYSIEPMIWCFYGASVGPQNEINLLLIAFDIWGDEGLRGMILMSTTQMSSGVCGFHWRAIQYVCFRWIGHGMPLRCYRHELRKLMAGIKTKLSVTATKEKTHRIRFQPEVANFQPEWQCIETFVLWKVWQFLCECTRHIYSAMLSNEVNTLRMRPDFR